MRIRLPAFKFVIGLTATALSFPMLIAPTPSSAASSHSVVHRTLVSLVVSAPAGFTSDGVDQDSGGPTGSINFNEATSADCDPTALSRSQWVGSVLRYFDNNPADAETYVLLCVTQLRTSHDASVNRARVGALGASTVLASAHEPGVYLHTVGPAQQIFFSKGNYFVWIVAVDVPSAVRALSLGTNVAHREYALLPR